MTLLSFHNNKNYVVQLEYVEIVNFYEISNGKDEIDDVWNESKNEKVRDKNAVNITTI